MKPDEPLTPAEEAAFREVCERYPAPSVLGPDQKRGWIAAYKASDPSRPIVYANVSARGTVLSAGRAAPSVIANISARGSWRWFNPKGWAKYQRLVEQAEQLMDRAHRALTTKSRRKPELDEVCADLEAHADIEVRKNKALMGRPEAMHYCTKDLGADWRTASDAYIKLAKARPDLLHGVGKHHD